MDQRYLAEPYKFVKPRDVRYLSYLIYPFFEGLMKRLYQLSRIETRGTEHLTASVKADYGILMAANHCRYSDPFVLGAVTKKTGAYLYFCASWHLFATKPWQGRIINRLGAMSIYREGTDRECLRECQRVLVENERPLVLYPEGTFYRQNDRLGPLQDGVSFIARTAAKQATRPVVVHPVALKYWFVEDPRPAIERRLCLLEQRCHVHPRRGKEYVERLQWIANALLTVKEMEQFGSPQSGDLDERQVKLADHVCSNLEMKHFSRNKPGSIMDRIRIVRNHVVKLFAEAPKETPEWYELLYQIEDLAFAQQLFSHSWSYIKEWPSLERVSETLMRLEEDLYDEESSMAHMGCIIQIGEPIHVAEYMERKGKGSGGDPLTIEIGRRIQGMLDAFVAEGCPAHWNGPTGPGPVRSRTSEVVTTAGAAS